MNNLDSALTQDAEDVVSFVGQLPDEELPGALSRLLSVLGDTSEHSGKRLKAAFGIKTIAHRSFECDLVSIDKFLSSVLEGLNHETDGEIRRAVLLAAGSLMDSPIRAERPMSQSVGMLNQMVGAPHVEWEQALIEKALTRHGRDDGPKMDGAWLRDQAKFQSFPCVVTPAKHADGRDGWILQANRVPPGVYKLEVITSADRTRRDVVGVVLHVSERFRGSRLTSGRLAGSANDAEQTDDTFERFDRIRRAAGSEATFDDPVEGVVTEQEEGAQLLLFIDTKTIKTR